MHVLFLAPDTHAYNHAFLAALNAAGATVSAIGPAPSESLSAGARAQLAGYASCARLLDADALLRSAEQLAQRDAFDRIETIDEPLVEPAARLREALGLSGLSVETARLCRDKAAMKDHLRAHDIPCAESATVADLDVAARFAARVGFPLIAKPPAGFGSLDTHRVDDAKGLEAALRAMRVPQGRTVLLEEFVEGHEGFYDTITVDGQVRHDFAAHYFPGCLEAAKDRRIAPQIAVTNRIDDDGYRELREVGQRVIEALDLEDAATHMEWFFGPKGLRVSEIGARPAGEKIWDMYRAANDFDVYGEWARMVLGEPSEQAPSRRLAAGSVQVRPDRDGRYVGHTGVEAALRRCGAHVYEHALPEPGTRTLPLDKGWLCNTWFRLTHDDYDQLRAMMTDIGETVRAHAR